MPFNIRELIAGKPVTVALEDSADVAVNRMLEYDYSQLPVVDAEHRPVALVTHGSILRALDHLDTSLQSLAVGHATELGHLPVYEPDDDLFELLDALRQRNAALIVTAEGKLDGIVTSSDATDYLRRRSEDLMLVEDVESTVKRFILAFTESDQHQAITEALGDRSEIRKQSRAIIGRYLATTGGQKLDEQAFAQAFDQAVPKRPPLAFDELTLGQYIQLLLDDSRWSSVNRQLRIERENLRNLLHGVLGTRNALMHFRGTPDVRARERLKYASDLLTRHYDQITERPQLPDATDTAGVDDDAAQVDPIAEVVDPTDSRYARLGAFLGNQTLSSLYIGFQALESILGAKLPNSARVHRSWWANDETSHTQSINWLKAGWRVEDVDIEGGWVSFGRTSAREQLYKMFYEDLLTKLRRQPGFPLKESRNNGNGWIWVADIRHGVGLAHFGFSFAQVGRFRVELYIDNGSKPDNKAFFDGLLGKRTQVEADMGRPVSWERLEERPASRIAVYETATVTDEPARLETLSNTALNLMLRFRSAITKAVTTG
ncbi:MAG TPA: DUF4268 domain-containing protein [Myxococcaceae bacterium]|nr:DUF4268 domain-containing protein [Myxococcaceae bacterium]